MTIRRIGSVLLLAGVLGVGGCAVDRQTGKTTLSGAAAGAASGFVYDQIQKSD